MWPYLRPASLAVQIFTVALIAVQRDSRHKSVNNAEPFRGFYDYIVVGAGTAGCVVARRLSDDKTVTVLLLEAGEPQSFSTDVPGNERTLWLTNQNPEYNWAYVTAQQKRTGLGLAQSGVLLEPKGRVLGGSSTINRMVYNRGHKRDYDNWKQTYGAEDWSFENVLPYFIKSENNSDYKIVAQNPEYHGTDGPLGVTSDPNENVFLNKVLRSHNEFGRPTVDVNGPQQFGTSIMQLTIKDGYRSSSANAFIDPNPNPNNLFISTNSLVTRILFNKIGGQLTATGAEFIKDGIRFRVNAMREVILCAGAYESPKLLMLSGVGPKKHLLQHKIKPLVDLPVGNNLQDHPLVLFRSIIRNNTIVEAFPEQSIEQLYLLISKQRGPLSSTPTLCTHYSSKSNPDPQWANIVVCNRIEIFSTNITEIISRFSAKRALQWAEYFGPYLGKPYLVSEVYLRRPRSVGTVRLASADPYQYPIINPNFYAYKTDFDDMVEAVKFELYFIQNSLISQNVFLIPKPIPGCSLCPDRPIYECDSYIRCHIRQIGDKEYHAVGSCRMGAVNRPDTVVDPRLRVKHVSQLRVCDASVMPRIVNSNTNAPTFMIGEKCAHYILEDNH